ncbi:hypothetical protein ACH3XW_30080 [Acanthocheilonema viteae]
MKKKEIYGEEKICISNFVAEKRGNGSKHAENRGVQGRLHGSRRSPPLTSSSLSIAFYARPPAAVNSFSPVVTNSFCF